jgi:hypothetical protein
MGQVDHKMMHDELNQKDNELLMKPSASLNLLNPKALSMKNFFVLTYMIHSHHIPLDNVNYNWVIEVMALPKDVVVQSK